MISPQFTNRPRTSRRKTVNIKVRVSTSDSGTHKYLAQMIAGYRHKKTPPIFACIRMPRYKIRL